MTRYATAFALVPLLCILGCEQGNPLRETESDLGVATGTSLPWPARCDPRPTPPPSTGPQAVMAPTTQTHVLTMTASPSCTELPDAAKVRTYRAHVQDFNGTVVVWVVNSYDNMVGWANEPGFVGRRDGSSVCFDLSDDIGADYALIERIPGVGDLGYAGTARGTMNGQIVATFDGEYRLGGRACRASDHRVQVTPR